MLARMSATIAVMSNMAVRVKSLIDSCERSESFELCDISSIGADDAGSGIGGPNERVDSDDGDAASNSAASERCAGGDEPNKSASLRGTLW